MVHDASVIRHFCAPVRRSVQLLAGLHTLGTRMDRPYDCIGVPFEPATESARLRKVSRPMLGLIFNGTIAATPPHPGRSFAIGYILRHLGQRSNGSSNASHPPSRD
jgi:hypothetical protein